MKIIKTTVLLLLIFLVSGNVTFAQTDNKSNTLEKTQENIEELIKAKDQESPLDLGLRIEILKKALDLAMNEVKDLKISLIAFDKIDEEEVEVIDWKNKTIEELNNVIAYYETIEERVNASSSDLTLEEVQNIAIELKEWRDLNYTDTHDEVRNFLLIDKKKNVLKIINTRWDRIKKDMNTLQRLGYIDENSILWESLNNAKELIKESTNASNNAERKFYDKHINPEVVEEVVEEEENLQPDSLELTIRDEIRLSLQKMREAYQVFIGMGSSVRELLN
ncbi:MAG: hypothetical protein WD095_01745 [Candidatus Paceibacterota bacterium]